MSKFSKEKLSEQSFHQINSIHILLHYTDA